MGIDFLNKCFFSHVAVGPSGLWIRPEEVFAYGSGAGIIQPRQPDASAPKLHSLFHPLIEAAVLRLSSELSSKGHWDFVKIREIVLKAGWISMSSGDEEVGDPTIEDNHYRILDEEKLLSFFKRTVRSPESIRELARTYFNEDGETHLFGEIVFSLLPPEIRPKLVMEFCYELCRKRNRGGSIDFREGFYFFARIVALCSVLPEGEDVFRNLVLKQRRMLVEALCGFYENHKASGARFFSATREIVRRVPNLASSEKMLGFLNRVYGDGFFIHRIQDSTLPDATRLWLGRFLGRENEARQWLAREGQKKISPEALFFETLPKDRENALAYCAASSVDPESPLDAELLLRVAARLGLGLFSEDSDPITARNEEFEGTQVDFIRDFCGAAGEGAARLLIETAEGGHANAFRLFRSLTQEQKERTMQSMVALSRRRKWVPGYQPGLFLISRFIALFATQDPKAGAEILANFSSDEIGFILHDYFAFINEYKPPRSGDPLSVEIRESRHRELLFGASQKDNSYLRGVYERHPGLDPSLWMRFFLFAVTRERIELALKEPTLPRVVAQWTLEILDRYGKNT